MAFDLILRGGTIIDGTGSAAYAADIGVEAGVISAIGDLSAAHAEHELDVSDLVVAPGFIDAHTHSDLTCYQEETLSAASVRQGVTTEVCGNCGFSPFPFLPGRQRDVRRHVGVLLGPQAYSDLPTWRAAVEEQGFYSNLVSLVGHGSLRAGVFGFARRAPRSDDLDHMVSLAQASLEQGAAGLSSGLIYTPGAYAETTEIVQLCKRALAGTGRPYTSHVRGETHMIAEAVTEAIAIAREAEVPVHISHHKVAGRENWGRSAETLALVARARARGTDVQPRRLSVRGRDRRCSTRCCPPRSRRAAVDALLERLGERQVLQRLASEIEEGLPGWENIPRAAGWAGVVVASSPTAPECEGRSIADLAEEARLPALDYTAEFLKQTDGQVIAVLHLMAEDDVRSILTFDGAMIGSDGLPLPGKPHPRVAGTFGRVLGRYAREEQLMELPQALRKMTALPAERFGLGDRGVLAVRQGGRHRRLLGRDGCRSRELQRALAAARRRAPRARRRSSRGRRRRADRLAAGASPGGRLELKPASRRRRPSRPRRHPVASASISRSRQNSATPSRWAAIAMRAPSASCAAICSSRRSCWATVAEAWPLPERFSRRMSISEEPMESIRSRKRSLWVERAISRWNSRSMPRGRLDVGQLVAHPLVRHPQQCDVLVGCSFRREARQMDLEQRAHLVHLLEIQPDAVQEEAHRLSHRGGVDGGDAQAAARAHLDHALGGERSHGLSHDRARDAELLSQLALGRQAVADVEALREDRLEHHVRDLVREARLALDLVEEIRVVRGPRARSPWSHRHSSSSPIIRKYGIPGNNCCMVGRTGHLVDHRIDLPGVRHPAPETEPSDHRSALSLRAARRSPGLVWSGGTHDASSTRC